MYYALSCFFRHNNLNFYKCKHYFEILKISTNKWDNADFKTKFLKLIINAITVKS